MRCVHSCAHSGLRFAHTHTSFSMMDFHGIDDSDLYSSARMGAKPTEDGTRFDLDSFLDGFKVDEDIYTTYEDWAEANGIEPVVSAPATCTSPTFDGLKAGLDTCTFLGKGGLAEPAPSSPLEFAAEPVRITVPVQMAGRHPAPGAANSAYNELFVGPNGAQSPQTSPKEPEPATDSAPKEPASAPKESEPAVDSAPLEVEEPAPAPKEPVSAPKESEPAADSAPMEVEEPASAQKEPVSAPMEMDEPASVAPSLPPPGPAVAEEKLVADTQQDNIESAALEKDEIMEDAEQKPRPPAYISARSTEDLPPPLEEVDEALARIRRQRRKHMGRYRDLHGVSKERLVGDLGEIAKACRYISRAMKKDLKNALDARDTCLEEIMRRRDGCMIKFMREKGYEYAQQVTGSPKATAAACAYITKAMAQQSPRRQRKRVNYATVEKMIGLKPEVCARDGETVEGAQRSEKDLVMQCHICEAEEGDMWVCSIRGCDKVYHKTCLTTQERDNNSEEYPTHWVCPVCIDVERTCVDPECIEEAEVGDEEFSPEGCSDSEFEGEDDDDDGDEDDDGGLSSDEEGGGSDEEDDGNGSDSQSEEDEEVLDFTGPDWHNLDEYVETLKIPEGDKRAILAMSAWLSRLGSEKPKKYSRATAYVSSLLSLMACKEELEEDVRRDLEKWIAKFARHNSKSLVAEAGTIRQILLRCPVYVSDEAQEGSDSDERPKKRRGGRAHKAARAETDRCALRFPDILIYIYIYIYILVARSAEICSLVFFCADAPTPNNNNNNEQGSTH